MRAALLILFAALQVLDLYMTAKALKLGAVELNPVMRWVFEHAGGVWIGGGLVKAFVVGVFAVYANRDLLIFACAVYAPFVYVMHKRLQHQLSR